MPIIDDITINKPGAAITKRLIAHVLLDRSGSMGAVAQQTVDAYNEYVNGLAHTAGLDARISLTIFDSISIDLIRENVPVTSAAAKLTMEEFVPRGNTPLNDAIGQTVSKVRAEAPTDPVAFVILTDGLENSSREYPGRNGLEMIKLLLAEVQKEPWGWLVLFLGANMDAFSEGVHSRGTQHAHTMGFTTANVGATMQAAARASGSYGLHGSSAHPDVDFTEEERKKAAGNA